MRQGQVSKKQLVKKKGRLGVTVHSEGKYLCNCLTKNYRKWLGKKRYGEKRIETLE